MTLDELLANETSDEVMKKYYDMIKESYSKGEDCVILNDSELSQAQFWCLKEKGYTVVHNNYTNTFTISGW